jgi:hypothetical protein
MKYYGVQSHYRYGDLKPSHGESNLSRPHRIQTRYQLNYRLQPKCTSFY